MPEIVPVTEPANLSNLLNISEIYHKLISLGNKFPKIFFQEMSHESLPGNRVLARVPQTSFAKNTVRAYHPTISKFGQYFEDRDLHSLSPEEIPSFLTQLTAGNEQRTEHSRYSCLSSFFNFIGKKNDSSLRNPCDNPMTRKFFKISEIPQWKILEKEAEDEVMFRTRKPRNRNL